MLLILNIYTVVILIYKRQTNEDSYLCRLF